MVAHLISCKKLYKIVCFILAITLTIGTFPYCSKVVNAKENFKGIGIHTEFMVMKEGDKYKLNPYGYYDAISGTKKIKYVTDISDISKLKWKSSNSKIATIDKKGKLTAIKSGTCTITATYGKLKATSKIRVYTDKELYQHLLDADIAHDEIFMALTTNVYKNYDLIYDQHSIDEKSDYKDNYKYEKAAKKVEEIINTVVTDDMSDYEIMMALAAWLVENIEIIPGYYSETEYFWDKKYYYMNALLEGKSDSIGLCLTYELLLNVCGIRNEYMMTSEDFISEDGNKEYPSVQCNVIELDNEFYYFNISIIAAYMQESEKKDQFYDFITPEVLEEFININTFADKKECYEYGLNIREFTHYDSLRPGLYETRVLLGYNLLNISKYDYYFYDFIKNTIQFVTKKEDYKFVVPEFTTWPVYPDSTSTKYKEIMKTQAVINEKILDTAISVDKIYQNMINGQEISTEKIVALSEVIIDVENEFNSTKTSIIDRNAIKFMENKLEYVKKTFTQIQAKGGSM